MGGYELQGTGLLSCVDDRRNARGYIKNLEDFPVPMGHQLNYSIISFSKMMVSHPKDLRL